MKSFKSLIMLLIIIVFFSGNVNTCDSSDTESGCAGTTRCNNGKCISKKKFQKILDSEIRI